MARAKRTVRAEARRRYRATQVEASALDDLDDEPGAPDGSTSGRPQRPNSARPAAGGPGDAPVRPSILGSFRAAARPWNLREDIAYIPTLALRTRAVWIPAAAAIGSGVLFAVIQPLASNGLANLLFQLFVLPPTIAGSFLAGILAPRATYIAGGIAALIGALVFAITVLATPSNILTTPGTNPSPAPGASADASAAPSPAPSGGSGTGTDTTTNFDKTATIVQSLLISVPFGVAIGGFGGYYKRFLNVSNPNRRRRELERQRSAKGRGDAKKRF